MAKLVPDIPITVITNSVKVIVELNAKEKIQVIATGGILTNRSMSFIGPLAERSLLNYHVDKAFISSKGAYIESGISESNEMQAIIKQKMISIADETYILCDHSKFQVQHLTQVASWDDIDHVITDDKASPEILDGLRRRKVNVIIAESQEAMMPATSADHLLTDHNE
jgi:Transcriptional regulators of sugar metabolism